MGSAPARIVSGVREGKGAVSDLGRDNGLSGLSQYAAASDGMPLR